MDLGTSVHAGLAGLYAHDEHEKCAPKFDLDVALAAFEASEPPEDERGMGRMLLEAYVDRYAESDKSWRVVAVEQEMELRLGDEVLLLGRADLIAEIPELGGMWHVQHKTAGATTSPEAQAKAYDLSWHERAYALMARARGWELKGTVLNILRKTKEPRKNGLFRYFVPVKEHLLERFKREAEQVALILATAEHTGSFRQNPTQCTKYNKPCIYHELCGGMPLIRELWQGREEDYVERRRKELGLVQRG
jgi:hypothetical protein